MRRYPPTAVFFIATTTVLAMAITSWAIHTDGLPAQAFILFLYLGLAGALSLQYPVQSARGQATYTLANTFTFAGVLMLPLSWVALLNVAIWTPSLFRRNPGGGLGVTLATLANAGQSVVVAALTWWWIHVAGAADLRDWHDVFWVGAAAIFFVLAETLYVSLLVAFYRRLSLRHIELLHAEAVLSELFQPFLGAILAVLYTTEPTLLLLAAVPMVLIYRLSRSVHLGRLAELDAKTGLYNWRYFSRRLEAELPRAIAHRKPLALIFADLDLLREINNTYGHLGGDRVITEMAAVLHTGTGADGIAARFGGEEFVLLLPGTTPEKAVKVAEELRSRMGSLRIDLGAGQYITCTASFGVAICPTDGTTVEALMEAADHALYRAKRAGRNRTVIAGQAMTEPVGDSKESQHLLA